MTSALSLWPASLRGNHSFALSLLRDSACVLEFPIATCASSAHFYRSLLRAKQTTFNGKTLPPRGEDGKGSTPTPATNSPSKAQKQTHDGKKERTGAFELECVVATCLYLASKVEDTARRVSDVCNVVRRCRLRLEREVSEEAQILSKGADDNEVVVVGESYYERKDVILELERDVLRALEFQLYRTPQPHKYAFALVKRRYGEQGKAATKVEVEVTQKVDEILEAALFGDDSNADNDEEKVSEWEVKRVAVAATALAEEICGVGIKPKSSWRNLLDADGDGYRKGTTRTTCERKESIIARMREDVKVLKVWCAAYEMVN